MRNLQKFSILLAILLLPHSVSADTWSDRISFWEQQAFMCTEGGKNFPSKQEAPTPEHPQGCSTGDMTLFNGLLCAAGDARGCAGVKNAQDGSGRWWRSPLNIGKESSSTNGQDVSFSPDMALGVWLYALTQHDKGGFEKWTAWLDANRPCVLELKDIDQKLLVKPTGNLCVFKGWPRLCTDDWKDKRCTFRPMTCNFLEEVGTNLSASGGDLCRKVLRDFKVEADYILPAAELAAGGGLFNEKGYPMHLAAVEIFLLERLGKGSTLTKLGAVSLALREPRNPFFVYLAEGKTQHVKDLVLELCPAPDRPSLSRTQWAWEREAADKAWERSMYWDCIFMSKLLQ